MKKLLKSSLACLLAVCLVLPLSSCALFGKGDKEAEPFVMSADGKATCRVIYPSGAGSSTWRALANEFTKALRRITGVIADVAADTEAEGEAEILLGNTNRALSATATAALGSTGTAFSFTVGDGKFAICAVDEASMQLAISYFEMQYDLALGGTLADKDLSFPGDLALTRTISAGGTDPAELLSSSAALSFRTGDGYSVAGSGACNTLTATAVRGEVLYAALSDGNGNVTLVAKRLSDGELLQASEGLSLGHAVSMCYNPVLDLLVVLHEAGGQTVSLIDPEALTVSRTVTASTAMDAIAYDTAGLRYAVKAAGENRYLFLNNTMSAAGEETIEGIDPASLSTGTVRFLDMSADSGFLYLLYSATAEGETTGAMVVMLGYNGNSRRYLTDLELSGAAPLSLSIAARVFYVATTENEGGIAAIRRVSISTASNSDEPSSLFNEKNTAGVNSTGVTSIRKFNVYHFIEGNYSRNDVMQGGCTDGTYGYFFMEYQGGKGNYSNSATHDTVIVKVDLATNKMVKCSEPLKLGHSNDGCYNSRTGQLVVVYNGNNKDLIKFIDPETLTITEEKRIGVNIFSIAYKESTGQYVVGLSGGRDFAILDADFKMLSSYKCTDKGPEEILSYTLGTDLLTQGIDCDSKYVYFVLSGKEVKNGTTIWTDYLVVFDYNGNYQFTKVLPGLTLEIENIFHIGTDIYVACNGGSEPCYLLKISDT